MTSRIEEFTILISSIYKNMLKIKRQEMAKFGLKAAHAQCMLAMSTHPDGMTMSQLGEHCDLDKAAISRAVAEMAERGVILPRDGNENRYRVLLTLSPEGQSIVRQIDESVQSLILQSSYGVSEADREIHYKVLREVNSKLNHILLNNGENNSKGISDNE